MLLQEALTNLTTAEYVALFVGIPAAVALVLALLIFAPGGSGAGAVRYRVGEPWDAEPASFGPPVDLGRVAAGASVPTLEWQGGAGGRW